MLNNRNKSKGGGVDSHVAPGSMGWARLKKPGKKNNPGLKPSKKKTQ